jgi:hypothetical protein
MAKHPVDVLQEAKATAAKDFLAPAALQPEFSALAATTHPRQNVVGVGIGFKMKHGKATNVAAIHFYVEKKVPKSAVPKADLLPSKIDGVATDVIETGRIFAQQAPPVAQTRLRPAKGGASIGFRASGFVMAGTLGCLVTDGAKRFILSNNHVIANENALPLKSPIFQPGLLDNGVPPGDRIARLSRFIRIRKVPFNNRVDAAIAVLDTPTVASPLILPKVGKLGSTAPVAAAVGMKVHKHGRTTGYTRGEVIDVAGDFNIAYDFGTARFVDQIVIVGDVGSFSNSGDSGSLIVERSKNQATGLLFAGSTSHTIANHISDVLAALGVTLVI